MICNEEIERVEVLDNAIWRALIVGSVRDARKVGAWLHSESNGEICCGLEPQTPENGDPTIALTAFVCKGDDWRSLGVRRLLVGDSYEFMQQAAQPLLDDWRKLKAGGRDE